jgi:hypothetical protein
MQLTRRKGILWKALLKDNTKTSSDELNCVVFFSLYIIFFEDIQSTLCIKKRRITVK